MTNEEIIEGNKLIAEFIGLPTTKKSIEFSNNRKEIEIDIKFKYHESWNWLMPVLKKIDEFDPATCEVEPPNEVFRIYSLSIFADIETAYTDVVRFIK